MSLEKKTGLFEHASKPLFLARPEQYCVLPFASFSCFLVNRTASKVQNHSKNQPKICLHKQALWSIPKTDNRSNSGKLWSTFVLPQPVYIGTNGWFVMSAHLIDAGCHENNNWWTDILNGLPLVYRSDWCLICQHTGCKWTLPWCVNGFSRFFNYQQNL